MIIFIEVIYDTRTLYSIHIDTESIESVENKKTNILIKIWGLLNKTFMGTNWNLGKFIVKVYPEVRAGGGGGDVK